MRSMKKKWFFPTVVAIALSACGDDPVEPAPIPDALFSIDVTGAITADIADDGVKFTSAEGNSWTVSWRLQEDSVTAEINFVSKNSTQEVGTIILSDASAIGDLARGETGVFMSFSGDGTLPGFVGSAVAGSITITSTSEQFSSGHFTVTAVGTVTHADGTTSEGTVNIAGEFVAPAQT